MRQSVHSTLESGYLMEPNFSESGYLVEPHLFESSYLADPSFFKLLLSQPYFIGSGN